MNKGAFWTSVEMGIRFLSDLQMYKDSHLHKDFNYTPDCSVYSRSTEFDTRYNSLLNNFDYDVILFDDSLLQFDFKTQDDIRMVYLQNPREFVSFEDFLTEIKIPYDDKSIYDLKEDFESDYRQYLSEKPKLISPTYFRYDVDSKNRLGNENIHAYAHLHVGLNNSIRIPVGIDMNPLTYLLFIVRHVYYDKWVEAIRNGTIKKEYFNCKQQCSVLSPDSWTADEKKALFLG